MQTTMKKLSSMANQPRRAALAATAFALLLLIITMAGIPQGTAGAQTPNNQATGKPTITGNSQAGRIMTAGTQQISDADGIPSGGFTYQWLTRYQGVDTEIPGATAHQYIPDDGDIGKLIRVQVSYTDDQSNPEGPLASIPSQMITRNPEGPVMWSATVTAEDLGDDRHGYSSVSGNEGGSISANTFSYRGINFDVKFVRTEQRDDLDELITIRLNTKNYGGGIWNDWALIVSDDPVPDTDVFRHQERNYFRFHKTIGDHHWNPGQKAAIALRMKNHAGHGKPAIRGRTLIGQILTANPAGITDFNTPPDDDSEFNYQWLRQNGDIHTAIPRATGITYAPTADDIDLTFRVRVTYTDRDGYHNGPFTSRATVRIANPTGREARVVAAPNMLPAPRRLYAGPATQHTAAITWSAHDDAGAQRVQYKKLSEETWATTVTGQTAEAMTIENLDCNTTYNVRVTAQKRGHTAYGPYATARITTGLCPQPYRVTDLQLNQADNCANLSWTGATSSRITGYEVGRFTIGEDEAILVDQGPAAMRSHRDCSAEYRTEDASHSYFVSAIYQNEYRLNRIYTSQVIYTPQGNSQDDPPSANNPVSGKPTISGTPKVGQALTAGTSAISDEDGAQNTTFTYRWKVGGATAAGQTGTTYVPRNQDTGRTVTVTVSFVDDEGNAESTTSAATAPVAATTPQPPTNLALTNPSSGTLEAAWTAPTDNGGATVSSYRIQWKEAGDSWDSAADVSQTTQTATSHTIGDLTNGAQYHVRVIAANTAGDSEPSAQAAGTPLATTPLTVATENMAVNHNGTDNFTFDLRFSENLPLSYVTLRDHAFTVTDGNVRGARWLDAPSNIQWRITVKPSGNKDVRVQLPQTTDCNAEGAICTSNGRKLSTSLDFTAPWAP